MSTPTSTARDEAARIRHAVTQALGRGPVSGDAALQALRAAVLGEPLLARDAAGAPAFWFVPLLSGARACGFARVALDGRVAQVGGFGAGAHDTAAWPEAGFFLRPPPRLLDELRARHPGEPLAEPVFGYDGSPARWAWRVDLGQPPRGVAYITPAGWYERPAPRAAAADREG